MRQEHTRREKAASSREKGSHRRPHRTVRPGGLSGLAGPLNAQSITQLQTTVGNATVQLLLSERAAVTGLATAAGVAGSTGILPLSATPLRVAREDGPPDAVGVDDGGEVATAINVPPGQFKVTDKKALLREAPPDFAALEGKPTIEKGTGVEITEAAFDNGNFYVKVNDAEGTELGWTSAVNMKGLKAQLRALNPQFSEYEMIEGDPVTDPIPGLPPIPEIEHTEFQSIVDAIATMESEPLSYESAHREEMGDARQERVEAIAGLRGRIASLSETMSDEAPEQIQEAQAYLYRRLAPMAPYFNQIANTNMLASTSEKGWLRTCNVTVPAMCLEGLGKTKADYDQSRMPLLRRVFDALEGQYLARKSYEDATDFDALRFPDFLSVVGIAYRLADDVDMEDETKFNKAVAKARDKAAKKTTHHSTMVYLMEQFGATIDKDGVHAADLKTIGTARKGYTKAKLRGQSPTSEQSDSYASVDADALLAVSDYRKSVLRKINPILDRGSQVLVGMKNHFVRLDGLNDTTVQVDDPGERGFKNLQLTWEQARDLGMFKGFWEISL